MGKVEKHTEYYCDICGQKIGHWYIPYHRSNKFYKIRCYDFEGCRKKNFDYTYVCEKCMNSIVTKVRAERRSE